MLTSWKLTENVIQDNIPVLLFVSVSEDTHAAYNSVSFGDAVQIRKSFIRSKPGAVSMRVQQQTQSNVLYSTALYLIYSFIHFEV